MRQRDQLVFQVPAVRRLAVVLGHLAELVAHHVEGFVVQAGFAEVAGIHAVCDQRRDAHPDRAGIAAHDQGLDRRLALEGAHRGHLQPQVDRPHDLDLAERDAAGHLLQVFAEGRLQDQRVELAQAAGFLLALGPVQHLAKRHDVGRQPRIAVRRELLALQERRVDPAPGRDQRGHRPPGLAQEPLGGLQGAGAGGQQVGYLETIALARRRDLSHGWNVLSSSGPGPAQRLGRVARRQLDVEHPAPTLGGSFARAVDQQGAHDEHRAGRHGKVIRLRP
jgi:hypothetical protein